MSMNSDLGFEPGQATNILVLDAQGQEASVARKFQLRAMELAKQGILGSLKTRKASLQNAYSLLVSLVDNTSVPFMIYGEKGAGKRRLVDEYLTVQNFYRRLSGKEMGHLKVLRGDSLNVGFSARLLPPAGHAGDLIYIENLDLLNSECQEELLSHLKERKKLHLSGVGLPRIIVGTEKALSIMVIRNEFSRELFQLLTAFAIFLPSLNERSEDFPHLIQSLGEEITGSFMTPPSWLVDLLSRQIWSENMDELKGLLKSGFARNSNLATWSHAELPEALQPVKKPRVRFDARLPDDIGVEVGERERFKQVLLAAGGNRDQAALRLGLNRVQFLQKLMSFGLR